MGPSEAAALALLLLACMLPSSAVPRAALAFGEEEGSSLRGGDEKTCPDGAGAVKFVVLFNGQCGSGWLVSMLNRQAGVFMGDEVIALSHIKRHSGRSKCHELQVKTMEAQFTVPLPREHDPRYDREVQEQTKLGVPRKVFQGHIASEAGVAADDKECARVVGFKAKSWDFARKRGAADFFKAKGVKIIKLVRAHPPARAKESAAPCAPGRLPPAPQAGSEGLLLTVGVVQYRKNIVKHAVSNIRANMLYKERKVWHVGEAGTSKAPVKATSIAPKWMARVLEQTRRWNKELDEMVSLFDNEGVFYLAYEDLLVNPKHEVEKLMNFLGVEFNHTYFDKVQKNTKDDLSHSVENWDEFKSYITEWGFGGFLGAGAGDGADAADWERVWNVAFNREDVLLKRQAERRKADKSEAGPSEAGERTFVAEGRGGRRLLHQMHRVRSLHENREVDLRGGVYLDP